MPQILELRPKRLSWERDSTLPLQFAPASTNPNGEEGALLMAIKQEVLSTGIGIRTETTVTFQGETHYYDLTVEPLRDALGVVVGVTCAAADITYLKQAAVKLEHLNQLKNEFLGMAAHDLRNPIATSLFLAELLCDEVATVLTEEQLGYLSDIRSSNKFMLQLIDDLLDVSSIEAGLLRLGPPPVGSAKAARTQRGSQLQACKTEVYSRWSSNRRRTTYTVAR